AAGSSGPCSTAPSRRARAPTTTTPRTRVSTTTQRYLVRPSAGRTTRSGPCHGYFRCVTRLLQPPHVSGSRSGEAPPGADAPAELDSGVVTGAAAARATSPDRPSDPRCHPDRLRQIGKDGRRAARLDRDGGAGTTLPQ